jgi:TatD DNase family protein
MITDSHAHLHLIDYRKLNKNLDDIVLLANKEGIFQKLCVSTNIYQNKEIMFICKKYDNIYGSIGIHPNEKYKKGEKFNLDRLLTLSNHNKIKAIGETGLDYYPNKINRSRQIKRFEQHIEASIIRNIPLVIHSRNARNDTINILKFYQNEGIKGVLHCFSEDLEMAKKLIDIGFLISFSGIVTFKNENTLKDIAKSIPLESFIVETDSPYLAPDPFRGCINQPSYLVNIVKKISILTKKSFKEIASVTTNNFKKMFLSN